MGIKTFKICDGSELGGVGLTNVGNNWIKEV